MKIISLVFNSLVITTLLFAVCLILFVIPAEAATYTVKMGSDAGELKFVPEVLEIKPGDTVEWMINKVPPHNVVFDDAKIPNGNKVLAKNLSHKQLLFKTSESFQTTFPEDIAPGSYTYYCEPHRGAGMVGEIVVQD